MPRPERKHGAPPPTRWLTRLNAYAATAWSDRQAPVRWPVWQALYRTRGSVATAPHPMPGAVGSGGGRPVPVSPGFHSGRPVAPLCAALGPVTGIGSSGILVAMEGRRSSDRMPVSGRGEAG